MFNIEFIENFFFGGGGGLLYILVIFILKVDYFNVEFKVICFLLKIFIMICISFIRNI